MPTGEPNEAAADATAAPAAPTKLLLNVGCGPKDSAELPPWFPAPEWRQIRLDIDPAVEPDIVCSTTDMRGAVADESVDAIWSAHNVEHLFFHEVRLALAEFARVLKPAGIAFVMVPDLQRVAEMVARDELTNVAYTCSAGQVTPLDMIYGFRVEIAKGRTYMAHKTGFTASTLRGALADAGLRFASVRRIKFDLLALASKQNPGTITLGPGMPIASAQAKG